MKLLKDLTGDALEHLMDCPVVDQHGDGIGTLHSLWSHPETGAAEFLGVRTGWLFGHNHVVPAGKAELDEAENVVRLPYTEGFIKDAPAIQASTEISEEDERRVYHYYGLDEGKAGDAQTIGTALPLVQAAARADAGNAGENRWRRTSTRIGSTHSPIDDAASGGVVHAGDAVRGAMDDLAPGDSSGVRTPTTAAEVGSYGTTNLSGSTGSSVPVSGDSLGEDFAREDAANAAGGQPAAVPTEPGKGSDSVRNA